MKKYYIKYLTLVIIGSIIIGLAFYLFLNNYLDKKEIIVASRDISVGETINEEDLYFKEYYKNPKYIKMIRGKFGPEIVKHINEMLKQEIYRKFA